MPEPVVIRGRYEDRTFIPDQPLPDTFGLAELIIQPVLEQSSRSIFDLFGKATRLRSAEDINSQLAADREEWGEP